jgi:hypothetical protein
MTAALRIVAPHETRTPVAPSTPSVPKGRESGIAPRFNPDPVALALSGVGLDLAELSVRVTSADERDPQSRDALRAAWTCWSESQRALLEEVGKDPSIPSDEFTRQDQWLTVRYGKECMGVAAFRWLDLDLPYFEEDSYFRVWPEDARRAIRAIGSKVCLVSNVAVARAWRGRFGAFNVKSLLVGLGIQHFNESDADLIVATMRNMRGMNKVTYHFGATPLVVGLTHPTYGEEIDLITVVKRPDEERFPHDLNGDLTRIVWRDQKEETS